jgi:8-oxo-dGTP pyrophosphatase MutT (NUDIX family)
MDTPFAVFIVANLPDGRIAATTRPDGRIGLPGGKVDPGELPVSAALREAAEEGWAIHGTLTLAHSALVEGRLVHWFALDGTAHALLDYKEKYRGIRPIAVPRADIASSGFGNDWIGGG